MFKAQEIKQEIKRQVRKSLSIFMPWEPPLYDNGFEPIINQGIIIKRLI
jgi:hypothetical protein